MKIIILGAGRVGASLVENLVSENNDITIVDTQENLLTELGLKYDIRTIIGNGSLPSILSEAEAQSADLLIAVTHSDDTNLVACKIAATQFHVPLRIARLRASDYREHPEILSVNTFAVNYAIAPEEAVTHYICKLIEYPEALQILEFAYGMVKLICAKVTQEGLFVGHPLRDIHSLIKGSETRIVAIFRNNKFLAPDGDTVIMNQDEVFCLAAHKDIRKILSGLRQSSKPVKNIMIAGGGNIGLQVAHRLENQYRVKLIEVNARQTRVLKTKLKNTLILQGDCTDENLLREENIDDMELFLALTNDDENNIMSSLLAKRLGAERAVALINRQIYANLVQDGQIDITLSPAQISIGLILAHVRHGDIAVAHSLRHGTMEALEFIVHGTSETCKVVDLPINQIPFPAGVSIGAIVRLTASSRFNNAPTHEVIMPHHDTIIKEHDHVIVFVFVANKSLISKVEKLFQVH